MVIRTFDLLGAFAGIAIIVDILYRLPTFFIASHEPSISSRI